MSGLEGDVAGIGVRLREAREFLNVSLDFVQAQTGISKRAVEAAESGSALLSPSDLKKLAQMYRLSVSFILAGRDEEGLEQSAARALRRASDGLSTREVREVERFALFLQNYRPAGRS